MSSSPAMLQTRSGAQWKDTLILVTKHSFANVLSARGHKFCYFQISETFRYEEHWLFLSKKNSLSLQIKNLGCSKNILKLWVQDKRLTIQLLTATCNQGLKYSGFPCLNQTGSHISQILLLALRKKDKKNWEECFWLALAGVLRDEEVLTRGIRHLCFVKPWLDRKYRENLATEMVHPPYKPKSRFSHRC